jgi:hypothetical protein
MCFVGREDWIGVYALRSFETRVAREWVLGEREIRCVCSCGCDFVRGCSGGQVLVLLSLSPLSSSILP